MNIATRVDPFANMSVKRCFCGKPTVEDHDFCFCSPECARADAMRALGGDDCHYRKVVRKAYVNSGAAAPAIYKSEDRPRQFSITKGISGIIPRLPRPSKPTPQCNKPTMGSQGERNTPKDKVFPTLAQVTSAILARKEKKEGDSFMADASSTNSVTVDISPSAVPLPPDTPAQQTKPGFGRDAPTPALAHFRSPPRQTVPLQVNKKIAALKRRSSILHAPMEEVAKENGDEIAFSRVPDRRTEDKPMSPRPQRQIPGSSIHSSSGIRPSASFAGWRGPVDCRDSVVEEGESLMRLFNQLRDVRTWIVASQGTPRQGGA